MCRDFKRFFYDYFFSNVETRRSEERRERKKQACGARYGETLECVFRSHRGRKKSWPLVVREENGARKK